MRGTGATSFHLTRTVGFSEDALESFPGGPKAEIFHACHLVDVLIHCIGALADPIPPALQAVAVPGWRRTTPVGGGHAPCRFAYDGHDFT